MPALDESLQIIIPIAGRGQRFAQAGFTAIKPLIPVDGKPMLEHIVSLFPGEKDVLFICTRDHLQKTALRKELNRIAPWGTTGAVDFNRMGPVASVLAARHLVHDEHPVLVAYCDFLLQWDFAKFAEFLKNTGCDGCLPACQGFHPHALGTNTHGVLKLEGERVRAVREQQGRKGDEPSAVGMYYFKTGALMKHYFSSVLRGAASVEGEYVASLAYNAMIADGLDVRYFEVDKFIQFETPGDLRQYERWSDYFATSASWKPRQAFSGSLLVPLAGEGTRFADAGYHDPKPAVPVLGTPMLARASATWPRADRTIAVVPSSLKAWNGLPGALGSPGRLVDYIEIGAPTEGPAHTCLLARHKVPAEEPLWIVPSDVVVAYDETKWSALRADAGIDFSVCTFRNDCHANRQPGQYAWIAADRNGKIERIQCREPLRKDPSQDPGSSGILWFRRAADFFDAAEQLIASGQKVGDEYWLETVAQKLLTAGKAGKIFDLTAYVCLGTPDELLTFEYWADYFRTHLDEKRQSRKTG